MKKQSNYPLYDVTPFSDFKEMLTIAVKEAGDKIAFKFKNEDNTVTEISYKSFYSDVTALGCALTSLGLSGLHVACIGENCYKWVVAYLAMLGCTGVFVPIDKELPPNDIINVIENSDSEVVFYSESYEKILNDNMERLGKIRHFIGLDRKNTSGKYTSFDSFIEEGRKSASADPSPYLTQKSDPNKLKMLVYTSGTTGMSKGVMLSEHNLVSCVYYGLQISTVYDTCLSVLPYHHTYESVCGLLVSLHMHSTICINDKIRNVLKNLQLFKPSYLYLVPAFAEAFYKKIWQTAKEGKKDKALKILINVSNALRGVGIDMRRKLFGTIHESFGGRLRKIVCGGAPIRPEIGEFFDAIGINLINGYGITECSPLVSANRDNFNDFKTTGVKLPCIEVKIDSSDDEGRVNEGVGEICIKGDTVMLGYYKNPEETARVLKDGWFYTGDYGIMNEKGQLLITGRKKNLIVLNNGKNIYPEEIENYIMSIPYVTEVVVYALKDDTGSENALCAEAFLNEEKLTEMKVTNPIEILKQDIGAVCRSLPPYKQIKKVVLRSIEFDKTTSKKIKRSSIRG
ncbi:MAG: AMP-dependent synthetase/ligase [Eubacteriales bacterium]